MYAFIPYIVDIRIEVEILIVFEIAADLCRVVCCEDELDIRVKVIYFAFIELENDYDNPVPTFSLSTQHTIEIKSNS